jgi:lipoate-protein ligase A
MTITLRIISDKAQSAAFNMAADLFVMESCAETETITLRFYEWEYPSITLGFAQKAPDILDFKAMEKNSVQWVRRPTGGRAVLHENDITYSCIFPIKVEEMGKNISGTYTIISRCLMSGLYKAGIMCEYSDSAIALHETRQQIKLPCFLAPNRNEIMYEGRKLFGSAQKRTSRSVLQHGSIPFSSAYRKLPEYLKLLPEERIVQKKMLEAKSVCIEETNRILTKDHVRKSLVEGFVEILSYKVEEKKFTKDETEKINAIAESEEFGSKWMNG